MNREKTDELLKRAAGECTCFHLRRLTRIVTQVFDGHLQAAGLRGTQFSLLNALALMGSATITDLARVLSMDRTTLTRNLKPVETQGWVAVVPGHDRRTRELSLTASGRRVLVRAAPYWERAQKEVVRHLGKKRWGDLMREIDFAESRLPEV